VAILPPTNYLPGYFAHPCSNYHGQNSYPAIFAHSPAEIIQIYILVTHLLLDTFGGLDVQKTCAHSQSLLNFYNGEKWAHVSHFLMGG
jgi:hypothetical protein